MKHKKLLAVIAVTVAGAVCLNLSGCGRDELSDVRKKAKKGDVKAQCAMARAYATGTGVVKDYTESAKWYLMAAKQGDAEVQCGAGLLYATGVGVPLDYAESVKWLLRSANQGYARGQALLGAAYNLGQGVPQDYKEAVKWFRLAAKQGNPDGQLLLGAAYFDGNGVPKDYALAYAWANIAAAHGSEKARESLKTISEKMSPEQIAEGNRLSTDQGGTINFGSGIELVKAPMSLSGKMTWASAVEYCNNLLYAGHYDWTLPRTDSVELLSSGIGGGSCSFFWLANGDAINTCNGKVYGYSKPIELDVWPVRYGQDEVHERGVPKVNTDQLRFTDLSDGTVRDTLTKLEWVKEPQALPGNSGTMSWKSATDSCSSLGFAGHSDWRLPSRNELESLVNCVSGNSALPDGSPFVGVKRVSYWSSTSGAFNTDYAWLVNMSNGYVNPNDKTYSYYVWPVRGGQ